MKKRKIQSGGKIMDASKDLKIELKERQPLTVMSRRVTTSMSNIGCKEILIKDESKDISFNALVQYPTKELPTSTSFGPYKMDVCMNGKCLEGRFPLVVISHGNGGSHLLYRTISTHLARNGFIVAMVEHYGNNRNNNELENTEENLILRPRHISLTIDKLLSDGFFGNHIEDDKIAIIGHSMGGYTALALAGGIPRTREGKKIETVVDSRVKTIVLLAPGAGWFMNGLNNVTIPILIVTAEQDPITPAWNAEIVIKGVQDESKVTFKQIENAGHFSFLSPFPESMRNPKFLPSTDPDGFDREKFHNQLPKDILAYLNEKLF